MSLWGEIKKTIPGSKDNKLSLAGQVNKYVTPSKDNKYSLYGQQMRNKDAKAEASRVAKQQKQAQIDLVNAQAENALADLSLENTPNIIAGGTADILVGTRKRRSSMGSKSISTQLGL